MLRSIRLTLASVVLAHVCIGCGGDDDAGSGARVAFDPAAALDQPAHFFDLPYPSDLRLSASGGPDLRGFPNPMNNTLVAGLLGTAPERAGYPVIPVAYFRFTGQPTLQDPEVVIAAAWTSPIVLVDVGTGPTRGRLIPTVADTPIPDDYVPDNLLAVAPRPGFVLTAGRPYAIAIRRALKDDQGRALAAFAAPSTAAVTAHLAPLYAVMADAGVAKSELAAATIFTTGDVVAELHTLGNQLVARDAITITDLHLDPTDGATQDGFCELLGTVSYPQYQQGTPPFNDKGLFQPGTDKLPTVQRMETAPITITLPKVEMPAAGYPLLVYFHGSGGVSAAAVDQGRSPTATADGEKGKGPAWVVAPLGLATAASALPVNPERLPGAGETAYLNIMNLAAFRDTFRQGVIEQRLFIAALRNLEIAPSALGACTGPALPALATAYKFAPEQLVAQGQSMGGMYTNLIAATEPRIKAVIPTGAGGFWSYFILKTSLIPNVATSIGLILGLPRAPTFLHPTMQLFETATEVIDPMVFMPRLAQRPLPSHPVRPIYEPVGKDDSYFPTVLYDAIALAYGHKEAGDIVWPTMQEALALDGRAGLEPYPVQNNMRSADGTMYTGAVIQFMGDGFYDPHAIYRQLDTVKHQYKCFLGSFLATGVARIPAPAPLSAPCD